MCMCARVRRAYFTGASATGKRHLTPGTQSVSSTTASARAARTKENGAATVSCTVTTPQRKLPVGENHMPGFSQLSRGNPHARVSSTWKLSHVDRFSGKMMFAIRVVVDPAVANREATVDPIARVHLAGDVIVRQRLEIRTERGLLRVAVVLPGRARRVRGPDVYVMLTVAPRTPMHEYPFVRLPQYAR